MGRDGVKIQDWNDFEIVLSDRSLCDSGDLLVSDGGSLLHIQ